MSETVLDLIAQEGTGDTEGSEAAAGLVETDAGKSETDTKVEPKDPKPEPEWKIETILEKKEWTPDDLTAAGKFLRGQAKMLGKAFTKADRQGKSAQRDRVHHEEQARRYQSLIDQHNEDLRTLRDGDESSRAAAIRRLFNEEPLAFVERMTLKLAGRDDLIKANPQETNKLESKISELEKRLAEMADSGKRAEEIKKTESTVLEFYETALSSADEKFAKSWPNISAAAAPTEEEPDRPRRAALELLEAHRDFAMKRKGFVATEDFLDWAERQMRVAGKQAQPQSQSQPQEKRAPVRASAHKTVPRSVEQTTGTGKREPTQAEYDEAIASFFGWG